MPTKYALILIDLIEDYFDASIWPGSELPARRRELVTGANDLVRICRQRSVPVIWVRQEFRPDFSDAFPHARRAGVRYAVSGTEGSALLQELDVALEDEVLTKARFSAFYGTGLDDVLSDLGITGVILSGITTAWCVRSTAVDAYQRDLEVLLASDCMAAFDEASHRGSLSAMNGYIATCFTNPELAHHLDSAGGLPGSSRRSLDDETDSA